METLDSLRKNIESVIIGKSSAVEKAIITLLAQGHLLIEDIPGVGKSSLAYALARFGASLVLVPFPGMEIPAHVLERLERDWNSDVSRAKVGDLIFDGSIRTQLEQLRTNLTKGS